MSGPVMAKGERERPLRRHASAAAVAIGPGIPFTIMTVVVSSALLLKDVVLWRDVVVVVEVGVVMENALVWWVVVDRMVARSDTTVVIRFLFVMVDWLVFLDGEHWKLDGVIGG